MTNAYDDIIHLPHPDPKRHSRMTLEARAAQFAPFAALTGHQTVLAETARYMEQHPGLDNQQCDELNRKINRLLSCLDEHPIVIFTFFEEDATKFGGCCRKVKGRVIKFNDFEKVFTLDDGVQIALSAIVGMEL